MKREPLIISGVALLSAVIGLEALMGGDSQPIAKKVDGAAAKNGNATADEKQKSKSDKTIDDQQDGNKGTSQAGAPPAPTKRSRMKRQFV